MRVIRFFIIFLIILGWVFPGWPGILSRAQEATPTQPEATSTPEFRTSTPIVENQPSAPESLTNETQDEEVQEEEEEEEEEESQAEETPVFSAPPEPQPPAFKERKFDKEVRLDKNARHSCSAKNFSVNLSAGDPVIVELELNGLRSDTEDIEIGSLPLGIDITFLNNADYSFSPRKSDSGAVLQITNQLGSQKGNFSIPIIYTSGNSTAICQINVVNF